MPDAPPTRLQALTAAAVLLPLAALYLVSASPWLLGGDNAEFVTLSAVGGVAHPSGYPLYTLLLRLAPLLPASSHAHAAALLTAMLAAAQLPVLSAACRAWGARPGAALLATALYATGPIPLLIYTQAEVFALNGLIAALILWIAADRGPLSPAARLFALAVLAGLGVSNHLSAVLLAPIGLYGAVRALLALSPRGRLLALPAALLALATVVGLYATLLLPHAPDALTWGDPQTLADLLDHARRRDYGSLQLSARGHAESVTADNLAALAISALRAWAGPLLVAVLISFGRRCLRPAGEGQPPRAAWIALLATLLLAGPVFIALFNINPQGIGLHVIQRFHLLPCLLLVIPAAAAFSAFTDWLLRRDPALARFEHPALAILLTLAVAGYHTFISHEERARLQSPAVERYLAQTLAMLPDDAILISNGDHRLFGFAYLQHVERARPDVLIIDDRMIAFPWYHQRLARQLGREPLLPGPQPGSVRLAAAALQTGRPVLLAQPDRAPILATFPTFPQGTLIRVLPPDQAPPTPEEAFKLNAAIYDHLDLDYALPEGDDGWPVEVHERYAQTWFTLAEALEGTGRPTQAAEARQRGCALAPWRCPSP